MTPLEHLLGIGLILGFSPAVLPGPFLDAQVTEVRMRHYAASVTFLGVRSVVEVPLLLLFSAIVSAGLCPLATTVPYLVIVGVTLGGWGWYLIDRTSYLSQRLEASYERLRATPRKSAIRRLLGDFWRRPRWWVLWTIVGSCVAMEIGCGVEGFAGSIPLVGWPLEWWVRAAAFTIGYYLPSVMAGLWVAFAMVRRSRYREGDFYLLPNRPYRIVLSITGMFLLFLGFGYGMNVLRHFVDISGFGFPV